MKKLNNWINNNVKQFFTHKTKTKPTIDETDTVSMALANAYQMSLEVEVVTWALKYMKENPSLTIDEAITMAYFEWIK